MVVPNHAGIDLIKTPGRRGRAQIAVGGTRAAVECHAQWTRASLNAASTMAAPYRFGVAVHARRVCVGISIVVDIGGSSRRLAVMIVFVTAGHSVAVSIMVVTAAGVHDLALGHKLGLAAVVIHAIDVRMFSSRAALRHLNLPPAAIEGP